MEITPAIFRSSIGQKIIMATTGLLLCLFIIGHLGGNLLLYAGKDAFNGYANALESMKAIVIVIEIILLLIVLIHIKTAINLTLENRRARPIGYYKKLTMGRSTLMSSHMFHSGMVVLIFLIYHVYSFKYGAWDNHLVKFQQTLYDLVTSSFANVYYSTFYVFGVLLLGFHLHHAVQSAFITLGVTRRSSLNKFSRASMIFAVVVTVGFTSFPIYFYLSSLR